MSRDINLDLTKPLSKSDPIDLRYALDRNLLDPADEVRVSNYLDGIGPSKKGKKEVVEDDEEEMSDLLAVLKGSVGQVNKRIGNREDLTAHEVELLLEAEAAGKNRKGVVEYLQSIEFEEEEESDEESEEEEEEEEEEEGDS